MSSLPIRWKLGTLGIFMLAGIYACVATGVGYDGDVGVGVGYVGGYYEPGGYGYGGWGGGYRVGPTRGGERGRPQGSRPYRAAPAGRATPSIPSHSRGPEKKR